MKHRIMIGLALMVGGVFAAAAQDALYVDPTGNVGVGTTSPAERLDVQGNAAVSGTLNVQGSATVNENLEVGTLDVTGSIGQLRATPVIAIPEGGHLNVRPTVAWTPVDSGTFTYTGGSHLLFLTDYSLYNFGGYPVVDVRLELTHGSGAIFHVPSNSGWVHHTSAGHTHHHKSASHVVHGLAEEGEWTVTFQAKLGTGSQASVVQFGVSDTMTVTVLELP